MLDYRERLAQLSTAMADSTRRQIFEYLYESGAPLSAREVAEHFGIHINAARIHLDKLAKGGFLKVFPHRGTLGGRPAYHYQVDEAKDELHFPPRHYKLLAKILAGAVGKLEGKSREILLEEAFRRGRLEALRQTSPFLHVSGPEEDSLARAWDEDLKKRGLRRRCRTLEGGGVETVFLSCPFGDMTEVGGDLVCDIHVALEEGRLSLAGNWRVKREGGSCTFIASPEGEAGLHRGDGGGKSQMREEAHQNRRKRKG